MGPEKNAQKGPEKPDRPLFVGSAASNGLRVDVVDIEVVRVRNSDPALPVATGRPRDIIWLDIVDMAGCRPLKLVGWIVKRVIASKENTGDAQNKKRGMHK